MILSNISYLNILGCERKNAVSKFSQSKNGELVISTNNIKVENIKVYYKNEKSIKSVLEYTPSIVILEFDNYKRTLNNSFSNVNKSKWININLEGKNLRPYLKKINKKIVKL